MKNINHTLRIFFFLLFLSNLKGATCISTGNGAWNNAASWSCGAVPGCGDSIVIQAGHTITITAQQDYTGCGAAYLKITIYGTLKFNNGNKLKLPCDSRLYIMSGGKIEPGSGGGNSNYIEICNDAVWTAADGTYTGPGCMPSTLPGCGVVLPVELTYFKGAVCNTDEVCLEWETASEKNNDYFEIQRSGDASAFKKIAALNSKAPGGQSAVKLSYEIIDNDVLHGLSYYRLKQVDKDFSFSYSKVIAVNIITEKVKFIIYPNPNSGEFTADISGLENNHEIKVVLRSLNGVLLFESSFFTKDQHTNIQIIPENKLHSGVYICSLYIEEIEYKVKVVVNTRG